MVDARNAVALTQALIQCPSVTPAEGGALRLLADLLGEAGFETHLLRFSAEGTPDIDNLYARFGRSAPYLLFAGHTDVVPVGDESRWSAKPFGGDIRDGKIYGRGATDMKGGVAASVAAALRFIDTHPDFEGSIGFLITGDEEGPAINGTVKVLQWMAEQGERFDHCILGEPTNPERLGDMIKIGRRGSLTGHIIVHGKQGHVAYPHLADNPIPSMMRLVQGVLATPLDEGTPHFSATNCEFTTIDVGNTATNVIPNAVRATFNIRFNDLWTPESLEAEIRKRLDHAAGNHIRYEARFEPTNAIAFMTEPGPFVAKMVDAIEEMTGIKPALSTTGGTSDARFICQYGPVIEFGLTGKTMHQIDEHAEVAEIEALADIYEGVLTRYFAS